MDEQEGWFVFRHLCGGFGNAKTCAYRDTAAYYTPTIHNPSLVGGPMIGRFMTFPT